MNACPNYLMATSWTATASEQQLKWNRCRTWFLFILRPVFFSYIPVIFIFIFISNSIVNVFKIWTAFTSCKQNLRRNQHHYWKQQTIATLVDAKRFLLLDVIVLCCTCINPDTKAMMITISRLKASWKCYRWWGCWW